VQWTQVPGGPGFDYPIDYANATVSADAATGHIELLAKWAPNAYYHYHGYLGAQVAQVLAGEQQVWEERPHETVHKIRRPNFRAPVPEGETHMEHGGPNGVTILFSIHAPHGCLFDLLDRDGNALLTATLGDVGARRLGAGG
jgi:hypothetical protein